MKLTALKNKLAKNLSEIEAQAKLHYLGSDPTRLKMLYLLGLKEDLRVTEIAKILRVSVSAISHQAKILEQAGVICKKRDGKNINYCPDCLHATKTLLNNIKK